MRVALDTNRLTDLFQGDAELADRLSECDEVWSPLIVLAEIKAGFYGGSQQHRNRNSSPHFSSPSPWSEFCFLRGRRPEHYAHLFSNT